MGIEQTRIAGGRLQLDADVALVPALATVAGELELREFALLRSPVLARIFTLASLEGLASALSGAGIPVERLTVPFTWHAARLELTGDERSRSRSNPSLFWVKPGHELENERIVETGERYCVVKLEAQPFYVVSAPS